MPINPMELSKICKEEYFTFEGAGNADINFQCTQNSCSSVLLNGKEHFQIMHMLISTNKNLLPIYANC